ncbi:hypothetical protein Tco_1489714 [Tanacetum coccineum]
MTDISYVRSSRNSNLMNMLQKTFGQNSSGLVLHLDDVQTSEKESVRVSAFILNNEKRNLFGLELLSKHSMFVSSSRWLSYSSVRNQFFKEKESVRFSALYLQSIIFLNNDKRIFSVLSYLSNTHSVIAFKSYSSRIPSVQNPFFQKRSGGCMLQCALSSKEKKPSCV